MGNFTDTLYYIQRIREGQAAQQAAQAAQVAQNNAAGSAQADEAFQREQGRRDQLAMQAGQTGSDPNTMVDPRLREIAGIGAGAAQQARDAMARKAAMQQALEEFKQGSETARTLGKQQLANQGEATWRGAANQAAGERSAAHNQTWLDVARMQANSRVNSARAVHQGGRPEYTYSMDPAARALQAQYLQADKEVQRFDALEKDPFNKMMLASDTKHQAAKAASIQKRDAAQRSLINFVQSYPGLNAAQKQILLQSLAQPAAPDMPNPEDDGMGDVPAPK